ncbi:MAG: hypothetical protein GY754_39770 [bacterium]|nr:hypothetical protein [bacterium]
MQKSEKLIEIIQEGYNLPDAYFSTEISRASNIEDVLGIMGLEQLTGRRFDKFYVDTDEIRGKNTILSLERTLKNPLNPYSKLLFSGFTGSGKTTELIKLCYELEDTFNIIIFSVLLLKIDNITIEALLFQIVEDLLNSLVLNELVEEKDEMLESILRNISKWCSETKIISEEEEKKSYTLSGGAGVDFFKQLFLKAKIDAGSIGSTKVHSSRIEENKINDLIFECNKIFAYIKSKTGKETLVIVDDFEKIPFLKSRDFYTGNAAFIRMFRCSMLLTIPVELVYHPDFSLIEGVFGNAQILPMIKIKDKKGKVYKPGKDLFIDILEHRIDLSLFEDECYKDAVKYSGGSIRELFGIVRQAALIERSQIITKKSMKKSILDHKDIFASRIQERHDEIKITFDEYLDVLFEIHDGKKEEPKRSVALLDLLRIRAVMKYNDEGFYDIHPLLDTFISLYKKKRNEN